MPSITDSYFDSSGYLSTFLSILPSHSLCRSWRRKSPSYWVFLYFLLPARPTLDYHVLFLFISLPLWSVIHSRYILYIAISRSIHYKHCTISLIIFSFSWFESSFSWLLQFRPSKNTEYKRDLSENSYIFSGPFGLHRWIHDSMINELLASRLKIQDTINVERRKMYENISKILDPPGVPVRKLTTDRIFNYSKPC